MFAGNQEGVTQTLPLALVLMFAAFGLLALVRRRTTGTAVR